MDASRSRFRSLLEWMVAAAVTAAAMLIGSLVFDEVRTIQAAAPVSADAPPIPEVPAAVPSRSISVPVLLLPDGTAIRVGERAATVASRLGEAAHVTSETMDRSASRERVTRGYAYTGMQFVLVLEAFGDVGEPRVTAIYLK